MGNGSSGQLSTAYQQSRQKSKNNALKTSTKHNGHSAKFKTNHLNGQTPVSKTPTEQNVDPLVVNHAETESEIQNEKTECTVKDTLSEQDEERLNRLIGEENEDAEEGSSTSDDVIVPIPSFSTPQEFEDAVYGYFRLHAYFGAFPSETILKDAQEWFRTANIKPPTDPNGIPVPHPPPYSKEELLQNVDFVKIDWHAITLPKELLNKSLDHVTSYLIRPAYSDVEKVRVLFRWITAQNVKNVTENETFPEDSTGWFLNNMRNRQRLPSELLKDMCGYAGIICHTIWGIGKGGNYEIGKPIEERGQWTAVYINQSWRLIDVHMASCYKDDKGSADWELIDDGNKRVPLPETYDQSALSYLYEHDEFYFLTDPEKFIFSHFPDEEKWQLLARPIDLDEMQDMAYLKGKFFELKMKPETHDYCYITCDTGSVELKLSYQDDVLPSVMYHFFRASDNTEAFQISPDGYVFLENLTIQRIINIKINFPAKGRYKLEIYGRDAVDECEAYETMCMYGFHSLVSNADVKLNPTNSRCEWGPGQGTQQLNMIPLTHEKGIVEALDGEAEIRFYVPNDMDFVTELSKCEDGEEVEKLQNFVIHRIENNEAIFNVRVPEPGEYTLNIHAANVDKKLENVCNYLIKCKDRPLEGFEFLNVHQGRLGPTSHFHKLGLSVFDVDSSAYINAPESGECSINIQLSKNIHFKPSLRLSSETGSKDVSHFVSYVIDGDIAKFKMRLPEQGTYAFSLYGKDPHLDGAFPLIYQALIDAHLPSLIPYEFPKCIAPLGHEVHLAEPKIKSLGVEETIAFEVACPSAVDIACFEDDEREQTKTPLSFGEDNVWRGDVRIKSAESKLRLSARIDENSDHYTGLFEFDSVTQIEKKKREEKQKQRQQSANKRFSDMQKRGKLMYIPANATDKYKRIYRRYDGGDLANPSASTKARLQETIKRSEQGMKPAWKSPTDKSPSKEQQSLDSRLRSAMRMEDKTRLKKEIDIYQKTSTLCNKLLLLDAEELLDVITLRDELQSACCKREMEKLKAIVEHIERKGLSQRSSKYVNEAKDKISRWENATVCKSGVRRGSASAHACRSGYRRETSAMQNKIK